VFLGGNFIELGLSQYGSFGTDQNRPAGFFGTASRTTIGMSEDLDGFNVGTDWRTDYFLPGTQEERWGIGYRISGTAFTAANAKRNGNLTQIANTVTTNESEGDLLKATSVGSLNDRAARSSYAVRVVVREGDRRVAGATVALPELALEGVTDDNGEVILETVAPGEHTFAIVGTAYASEHTVQVLGDNDEFDVLIQITPLANGVSSFWPWMLIFALAAVLVVLVRKLHARPQDNS
jgi:hypothetical protein